MDNGSLRHRTRIPVTSGTKVESHFLCTMQPIEPYPAGYVPTQPSAPVAPAAVPMGAPMQQPMGAPMAPVVPVAAPMGVPMGAPMPPVAAPVASQFAPNVSPAANSFSDHLNVLNQCTSSY